MKKGAISRNYSTYWGTRYACQILSENSLKRSLEKHCVDSEVIFRYILEKQT
jgi:NAD(P)H-flavin reductase